MGRIDDIIDRCTRLSPAPTLIPRIVALVAKGDYDPGEIERLIMADEAISAAVLRVANAAGGSATNRTFDLRESIARLGARTIRDIVLDHQSAGLLGDAGAAYGLRRLDLWRGSVCGGIAAELIATTHKSCDPGMAYVAGLLRDIGKLAVDAVLEPSAFAAQATPGDETEFTQTERDIIGVDHAELGAALAESWNIPEPIVHAVRYHHAPPAPGQPGADPLADTVHAADAIVLWTGVAVGDDGMRYRLADHVREQYALTRANAEFEIAETLARFRELEQAIVDCPRQGAA